MRYVGNKGNKQWGWVVLVAATREIVGVYSGARDQVAARKFWALLPPVGRQCAVAYTDFGAAYAAVLPSKHHIRYWYGNRQDQLYWAVPPFLEATGVSVSPKHLVLLKILGKPHWCALVFHPPLLCIIYASLLV